jgi:myo-inositol-1(or 4)-monophosphatase
LAINDRAIRRAGAAALDLAYLAAGRFDGFWRIEIEAVGYGSCLLDGGRSGRTVSNLLGGKWNLLSPNILASNGLIHRQMIHIFRRKSI